MQTRVLDSLDVVASAQWNALVPDQNPFLRHEFLYALERTGCVGARSGWRSQHVICQDAGGRLVGAVPLYSKDNSYGEFVFDWGWAEAYQRHGVAYYPKLVSAVPFTPATGPRLLIAPEAPVARVAHALIERALAHARKLGCSSLHWLFADAQDMRRLSEAGFMIRLGCHFHWYNRNYADFAEFLAELNAKKRKNIKRERRLVANAGVQLRVLSGAAASAVEWRAFHRFYSHTFQERGRRAPLSLNFFLDIAERMGEQVVLVLARRNGADVAGAISYRSASALFGRHWGCDPALNGILDSLHFECCYYQGIEYCIREGLTRFEPGVQGEHKIWRGFLPTLTHSAHWLAHPAFSAAVADFLQRETPAVQAYAQELNAHSPYRECSGTDA